FALPPIATANADTEAGPGKTRARRTGQGREWSGLRTVRPNTRNYSALRVENFVCSSTPSATATFDGLRRITMESDLWGSALPPNADTSGATAHVCYGPEADIVGRLNCHAADLTRATKACASVCRA